MATVGGVDTPRRPVARDVSGIETIENEPTIIGDAVPREGAKTPRRSELPAGANLGRYVVLDVIGKGGMGVVYAAHDRELNRKIALKVLSEEAEDEHSRARLLREAQAMARLEHPNVVRVYDVGTHGGRVFIAMAFIEGTSVRAWARAEARPWQEVLDVFIQAGRGLAAAHRVGLVHRDFKPENIMLTPSMRAKVMDFGLARAEGAVTPVPPPPKPEGGTRSAPELDLAVEQTVPGDAVGTTRRGSASLEERMTMTGAVVGTPAYMPPEQHLGNRADTKSDQFSFGASLWEGLYGQLPFAGENAAAVGVAVVTASFTAPPADRVVPSWLHAVMVRAMAPDPAERWESMDTLLAELQRDRGGTRRGRWLAVGALAIVAAVAVGASQPDAQLAPEPCLGVDIGVREAWSDARADRIRGAFEGTGMPFATPTANLVVGRLAERARALDEAARDTCRATRVRREQSEELLDLRMSCLVDQRVELETLAELLEAADPRLVETAAEAVAGLEPVEVCADVRRVRGRAALLDGADEVEAAALRREFAALSALELAQQVEPGKGRAAEALRRAEVLGDPGIEARAQALVASFEYTDSSTPAAIEAGELAVWKAVEADAEALTLDLGLRLSRWLAQSGRVDEGSIYLRLAESLVARGGAGPEGLAKLHDVRGALALSAGKYEEAKEEVEASLQLGRGLYGEEDPRLAGRLVDYGQILRRLGQHDDAIAQYELAVKLRSRALGPTHPRVATIWSDAANAHFHAGRLDEAERDQGRALEVFVEAFGPGHPRVARLLGNQSSIWAQRGQFDRSIALLDRAIAVLEASEGVDHPNVLAFRMNKGVTLWFAGRYAEAETIGREVLARYEELRPPDHPDIASTLDNLAAALASQGKYDEALPLFERALPIWEARVGPESPQVAIALTDRSRALIDRGTPAEAEPLLERALGFVDRIEYPDYDRAEVRYLLAKALRRSKRNSPRVRALVAEARPLFEKSGPRAAKQLAEMRTW